MREGILFPMKENNLDLGLGPVKKLIWTKVGDQTEMQCCYLWPNLRVRVLRKYV